MLYPDFNELVSFQKKAHGLNLSSSKNVSAVIMGNFSSPFRGQGLEFEEVREYAFGDDVRNIDWRVTARTGKAHMKVFKEEKQRNVMICVDNNASMKFGTRGTFKSVQAARIAALLGWQAHNANNKTGITIFGNIKRNSDKHQGMIFLPPSKSRNSLWKMFKILCSPDEPEKNIAVMLEDMLEHLNKAAPTGTLIYIISDFNSTNGNLEKQLNRLKKHRDIVLISVKDPADETIPAIGDNIFINQTGEDIHINTNNQDGRQKYKERYQQKIKQLENISKHLNIGIIKTYTHQDIYTDLRNGLLFINKRGTRK